MRTARRSNRSTNVASRTSRCSPGASGNRGTGFWALVYSLGGVYYPNGDRAAWALSAVARIEHNLQQRVTDIQPGADIVVDWGIGRMFRVGHRRLDLGISGFVAWQFTAQRGGAAVVENARYRLLGVGPEASFTLFDPFTLRARAQFEFAARDIVSGNNLWLIFNYAF